ncbi:YjhX family toxin [Roseovarius sp. S88]|uniref:YjhX family toxin n=1 Tax=Roseovarius phycicola TaxID=3080976 RepID=A0ABZ2HQ97_9RHOB
MHFDRLENGKVDGVICFTRDGHVLSDCTLHVFDRLRRRNLIQSRHGAPYRITRLGLRSVNAQLDNR